MKKIVIAEASDRVLDWLVAESMGKNTFPDNAVNRPESYTFRPTTDGNIVVELMAREFMRINPDAPYWCAEIISHDEDIHVSGVGDIIPRAVARCFVKFWRNSDVADVPAELLQ